ncbi:MAG: hypothetical protein IJ809_04305 [Clostridia bacterium]|nr:hypothetical protein [Clostridia bacterium]
MNKKGISLVVLVLTILVMLILTTVVIVNVSDFDEDISNAQSAKIKADVLTFKDELEMKLSANPRTNLSLVNANGEELYTYIPSIKNAKTAKGTLYSEVLVIQGGELKVIEGLLTLKEEEAVKSVISSIQY